MVDERKMKDAILANGVAVVGLQKLILRPQMQLCRF